MEVESINKTSDLQKVIDAFKKMENSSKYIFAKASMVGPMVTTFNNYQQFQQSDFKCKFNNEKCFQVKNVTINESYIKTYPLKVQKGRVFTPDEYSFTGNNSVFPIIVGANYGKYFKIGDEIPIFMGKLKRAGRIIGILKENECGPGDVYQPHVRYINLNNYIISTDKIYENKFHLCDLTLFNTNYILFDNSIEKSEIYKELTKIKKIFNSIPSINEAGIRDLNKYITQDVNMLKEQYEIIAITSISVIIFVCITFIISILDSIDKRKKEYGIHIMCGGKLSDIAKIMYLEIFITFFISYMSTVSIIYYKYGKGININTLIMLLIVIIIVATISALIPIIKIFNLNVNQLIKGEE